MLGQIICHYSLVPNWMRLGDQSAQYCLAPDRRIKYRVNFDTCCDQLIPWSMKFDKGVTADVISGHKIIQPLKISHHIIWVYDISQIRKKRKTC